MVKSKVKTNTKNHDSHHHKKNESSHKPSKKERREEIKKSGGIGKTLKNNLPLIVIGAILVGIIALVLMQETNPNKNQLDKYSPNPDYEGPVVDMLQFHDPSCQHCARQKEFNPQFASQYEYLNLTIINIRTQEGQEMLQEYIENTPGLSNERIGTPVTIVGDNYLIGYGDASSTGLQMANIVEEEYERLLADQEQ
ncbi:MAG: hypothetical protein ACLFPL_03160 [Candidatus Nanoarchaeia archaeon]